MMVLMVSDGPDGLEWSLMVMMVLMVLMVSNGSGGSLLFRCLLVMFLKFTDVLSMWHFPGAFGGSSPPALLPCFPQSGPGTE